MNLRTHLIGAVILIMTFLPGSGRGDGIVHLPSRKTDFSYLVTSAYPNPFTGSTTIFYSAPDDEFVSIRLYNSKGKLLGELFDDMVEKGSTYQFELDGTQLSPGVYYYTIESNKRVLHQRLELIR